MILKSLLYIWKSVSLVSRTYFPKHGSPITLPRSNKPPICLSSYWERVRQMSTSWASQRQRGCHSAVSKLHSHSALKRSLLPLLSRVFTYVSTCPAKTTHSRTVSAIMCCVHFLQSWLDALCMCFPISCERDSDATRCFLVEWKSAVQARHSSHILLLGLKLVWCIGSSFSTSSKVDYTLLLGSFVKDSATWILGVAIFSFCSLTLLSRQFIGKWVL